MVGFAAAQRLREEVDALEWYHTLELAPGLETPGWFDLRSVATSFPLPSTLAGSRCLDVGTFDGFWAFEMERRGAREVLAIDILDPLEWDWPTGSDPEVVAAIGRRKRRGAGFELASRELGSSVERRELSVYDLDRADIGEFDLIYLGSLLLHLRDPVGALSRVASVCAGELIVCDAVDPLTSVLHRKPVATLDAVGRPWWWKPNLAGLVRMVEAAGFELTRPPRRLRMPPGAGQPKVRPTARILASRPGREELLRTWRGDPHAIVCARPKAAPAGALA